jgi:hypothetical protein
MGVWGLSTFFFPPAFFASSSFNSLSAGISSPFLINKGLQHKGHARHGGTTFARRLYILASLKLPHTLVSLGQTLA